MVSLKNLGAERAQGKLTKGPGAHQAVEEAPEEGLVASLAQRSPGEEGEVAQGQELPRSEGRRVWCG